MAAFEAQVGDAGARAETTVSALQALAVLWRGLPGPSARAITWRAFSAGRKSREMFSAKQVQHSTTNI